MTAAEITGELETLADPADAMNLQRFFKTGPGQYGEGDLFRGIRIPTLRALVKKYASLPLQEARKLLHSRYHEDRMLALLIMVKLFAKGDADLRGKIYTLYLEDVRFINNWDLVDSSAEHIVGWYLRDKSKETLHRLARSESLWERRIAILSTFHFIKRGDFDDALEIATMLLNDGHDLIHKAVGWMLREIGKRDRAVENTFLAQYCRTMPRTALRYAIEHYPEPERLQFLRGDVDANLS